MEDILHLYKLTLDEKRPVVCFDELDRLPDSDLLITATPDGEIEATAVRLAASLDENIFAPRSTPRVAPHASGALSSDSLEVLRARGFAVGSLHPLVSISEPGAALENLRGAFYCVEGDAAAVRPARRIARARSAAAPSPSARATKRSTTPPRCWPRAT